MTPLRVLAVLAVAACAGPDPSATDGPGGDTDVVVVDVTFSEHIEPLLAPCVACHRGETADGSFDLTADEDMRALLVDVPSGQAASLSLVEPGDAEYSYLWHKINGTQTLAGGAGSRMPLGERWPAEDIELLGLWIDLGAAP